MSRLALLATVGVGAALVSYLAHRDRVLFERLDAIEARASRVTAAPRSGGPSIIYRGSDIDGDALASRVAARIATRPEATAPAEAVARPAEPSPESAAALSRASAIADGAIARGRLMPGDVEDLHQQLSAAQSPDESSAIRRKLLVAINTNRLVVDDPRFLP